MEDSAEQTGMMRDARCAPLAQYQDDQNCDHELLDLPDEAHPKKQRDWFIPAMLGCIVCPWTGIIAVYYAVRGNWSSEIMEDEKAAKKHNKKVKIFTTLSFILCMLVIGGVTTYFFMRPVVDVPNAKDGVVEATQNNYDDEKNDFVNTHEYSSKEATKYTAKDKTDKEPSYSNHSNGAQGTIPMNQNENGKEKKVPDPELTGKEIHIDAFSTTKDTLNKQYQVQDYQDFKTDNSLIDQPADRDMKLASSSLNYKDQRNDRVFYAEPYPGTETMQSYQGYHPDITTMRVFNDHDHKAEDRLLRPAAPDYKSAGYVDLLGKLVISKIIKGGGMGTDTDKANSVYP